MTLKKLCFCALLGLLISCGGDKKQNERVEEARQRGVEAAKVIVGTDHTDTLALYSGVLSATELRSRYEIAGDQEAAKAFDEAFRDYLEKNDPAMAQELKK